LRKVLAVPLALAAVVGLLLPTAGPAHATTETFAGCSVIAKPVNNSHGRLEVDVCVRHIAGHYSSLGQYQCFKSGTYVNQACNIGAGQYLFYNGTQVDYKRVSGIGLPSYGGSGQSSFNLSGNLKGCTLDWIVATVNSPQVRFSDGTLWTSGAEIDSGMVQGGSPC
jgi:hypothetical protein